VSALIRAELLKQRSIRTNLGLFAGLLGLVLFAVLLHGFGLSARDVDSRSDQMTMVFGWGEKLAALFAALVGAMSITGEIRHGTIRPTFLVTPQRGPVVAAKIVVSTLVGAGLGVVAAALAAGLGSAAFAARGIDIRLDGGDYAQVVAGAAAAAALWGALGVGLGAVVRDQVPTLIGICTWLLFVENLLVVYVADVGRFAPGAAGQAIAGQEPGTLLAPALGALVLALYSVAGSLVGSRTTSRRDVP
jgi:ABC-2 type transport system permease protein